jgi:acetyl esterase/lipase
VKKYLSISISIVALASACFAADITVLTDQAYKSGDSLSDYEVERCKLDLYLPTNTAFATLVWFHGGGLTGGSKDGCGKLGRMFAHEGIALAAANYRLSPKAKFPAYVEDAAAAVAWVRSHLAEHGGDSKKLFVGGHSAGGYLTSMLTMNPAYLNKAGLGPNDLAGVLPVSGQMVTHYTVRAERGISTNCITADDAAPIFYSRRDVPPMLVIMGDHDWPARVEENQYFVAFQQRVIGNKHIRFLQIPDRTHGSIVGKMTDANDPGREAVLKFIRSGGGD